MQYLNVCYAFSNQFFLKHHHINSNYEKDNKVTCMFNPGNLYRGYTQLTAGEDQLPHERANVTKGSDQSNPNTLRAFKSSFFSDCAEFY